ncbi:unnamed protein product [Trichobilharzia szidati]|nr:unnamed protein product [Trichobilharzia szidati]
MSFRFNPIAFISRRSSKTKTKARSESADQASLSYNEDEDDGEFQSPVVKARLKRSKKTSSSEQDPKSSSSIRAQVLASLRRTRSPRRKSRQQSSRAISVPPIDIQNNGVGTTITTPTSTADSYKAVGAENSKSEVQQLQPEQYVSDMESDYHHKFNQSFNRLSNTKQVDQKTPMPTATAMTTGDEESSTPVGVHSQSIEDINIQSNDNYYVANDDDNNNAVEQTSLEFNAQDSVDLHYDTEDEEMAESENVKYDDFYDDKSVTKLAVEYEVDYPVIEHSDDELEFTTETPKQLSPDDSETEHDTEGQDSDSTKSIQSSLDKSLTSVQHSEDDENMQWGTDHAYQDEIDNQQYVYSQNDDGYYQSSYDGTQENTVITVDNEQNAQAYKDEELQEQETTDEYVVDVDPSQDPFTFVELAASASKWDSSDVNKTDNYLTTPSIIITCASTESLMKINDEHNLTPPSRPPPPSSSTPSPPSGSTPKRPPPPPSLPSKEVPSRPDRPQSTTTTSQPDTGKKKRKKDKLFGLVDLGPLPTDPDPNFPFRSHFEKSVLPNPKKALQRIIRGETKAERRQRKEQQELNRLLKGASDRTELPVKFESSHSKDWQEFQELTARIQSTVEESTSKIKALSSLYPVEDNSSTEQAAAGINPESQTTENWAAFDNTKSTEDNWADFNQPIITTDICAEFPTTETDDNWAKFDTVKDVNQDESNLSNWADFENPKTADQLFDLNQTEQENNWAAFDQVEATQLVDPKVADDFSENWADFDALRSSDKDHSGTSTADENWANFNLVETNGSLPCTQTSIFNENTAGHSESKDILNLFNSCEQSDAVSEDVSRYSQEKTFEGIDHSERQDSFEDLFATRIVKEHSDLVQTDSENLQELKHPQTDQNRFELNNTDRAIGDVPDGYNFKETEDLFATEQPEVSVNSGSNHYSVAVDNLLSFSQTELPENKVEFNQTDKSDTTESPSEFHSTPTNILGDLNQLESSDNYFVVDRSGTTENLFGCDYPSPSSDNNIENIINSSHIQHTNIQDTDKQDSSQSNSLLPTNFRQLNSEEEYTSYTNFSNQNTSTLNFTSMEFDKVNKSDDIGDDKVILSNPLMETPMNDITIDPDMHVQYEQNDDFDVNITGHSSSDTSSYDGQVHTDVGENEEELKEETGIHLGGIDETGSEYHQNYDNLDFATAVTASGGYDYDNDVSDTGDNDHTVPSTEKQKQQQNTEENNPFTDDAFQDFSMVKSTTADSNKPYLNERKISIDDLKTIVRPRVKPVRQETLSGNNPFRKRSGVDEPNVISTTVTTVTDDTDMPTDELTRVAAGIKLISPQNKISRMKDSFDSNNSAEDEETRDVLQNVEVLQTIENINVDPDGFDPLQTIYPDSENEHSSDSNESKTLHVKINQKDKQTTNKSTVVVEGEEENKATFTIQPPPQQVKATNVLDLDIESNGKDNQITLMNGEDNEVHATEEPKESPPTPPGWVDFVDDDNADNNDSSNVEAFKLDKDDIDKAFEVQWPPEGEGKEKGKAEPSYPEPPRPETPDPELDIPFHPFVNTEDTWRLWLRYPEKKTRVKQISKYTTDRYWREVAIRLVEEHGRKVINIYGIDENTNEILPEPYRSVRVEPYMQLSREKLQQYDKYGKLHVFKLNHVSYKELVGMRPEKFSIKNLQNLVSHKPKQNITLDHIPIYTEILKFGSLDQSRIRRLMPVFEDALMKIPSHKDTSLNYSREEVCCYVVDEYEGKLNVNGTIVEQKARTRVFCTAFVNGGPHIVLGLNDKWRFGREVVRRCDILPVMHDEWISIRNPEFHSCVQMDEYEKDHMLQFFPLDGCRFELLRFRVSLRGNRELPMQVKVTYTIDGRRVSMRCDLLVPGYFSASKRSGAVPCEKVEIHIPFPEEWIYHFRVEKHHKYGSVHSTLRKPGKIKGLERITQMAQSLLPPSMLEASIGVAKYEHLYKSIVWRIPRVPEKSEASFRPHLLTCNLVLAAHDTVPEWETLVPHCQVEYSMPSSTVSGATVRSISVEHTGNVEKFVKYLTKYKYTVDIDYQLGSRKEPVIKSLLDDDTPVEYEKSSEQRQTNRQYDEISLDNSNNNNNNNDGDDVVDDTQTSLKSNETEANQTGPTEFGDLLGLGTDFGATSEQKSEQSAPVNTDDIF